MKLIQAPCDILILTADQAWENYCNALHLALGQRYRIDAIHYHDIAEESLDTYWRKFYEKHAAEVERRMIRANERGSV
jgi:hypothetical protein